MFPDTVRIDLVARVSGIYQNRLVISFVVQFAWSESSESVELHDLFGVRFVVDHSASINGCFGKRPFL